MSCRQPRDKSIRSRTMLDVVEWACGFSRKTITVLSPSPETFQLETVFSASRAFSVVSAAAGKSATGILNSEIDEKSHEHFECPPCSFGHVA